MNEKTKNIVHYSIGIVFLAGVMALLYAGGERAGDAGGSSYSKSTLSAMADNFDFGTVAMKDGEVTHEFELKNGGGESIVIQKVYTSCMCTTAYVTDSAGEKYGKFGMPGHRVLAKTNIKVDPGESAVLKAVFDPAAHGPNGVGLAQRSIYIETNSAKSPKLEVKFQAMVTR